MDDDRGPQYWRSINSIGGVIALLGALLMLMGLSQLKNHPSPPAPDTEDSCSIDNKPVPCSTMFPASQIDKEQEQARQSADGAEAFSMFGFLVFLGGMITLAVTASNLTRIRYEVMDYSYKQMQFRQNQGQSSIQIPCPFCGQMNDPTNEFCGKCGKPLTTM